MRQSRSISRKRVNVSSSPIKNNNVMKINDQNDYYYCHFRNAMYMGGIKSFQKHGRGILLHDDGTCAITQYFNDFKNGHNIYYKQNCIFSVHFQKNRLMECVIKVLKYLLLLRFNKEEVPDGKSILIDFSLQKIYYIRYKRGIVVEKYQQNEISVKNHIIKDNNIQYLIGDTHSKAIKLQVEKDQNIACQKISSNFYAGFYRKGLLNGLGFILKTKKGYESTSRQQSSIFSLQMIQRGYFYNGKLNGMGQKYFKNGNFYVGQFKQGIFDGRGILKNQNKKNWAYGTFQSGNLTQLIEHSNQKEQKKFDRLLQSIHQRRNNWIDKSIQMQQISTQYFIKQIQKIEKSNPTQKMKNLKQKKMEVLRKIQDDFLNDTQPINYQKQYYNSNQQNQPININKSKNMKNNNSNSLSNFNNQSNTNKQKYKQRQQIKMSPLKIDNNNQMYSTQRYKQFVFEQNTTKNSSSRLRDSKNNKNELQYQNLRKQNKNFVSKQKQKSQPFFSDQKSLELDSRRMIGRSRIFKQLNSEDEQLPRFSYTPAK